jgi:predicted metal-dependent peptidase
MEDTESATLSVSLFFEETTYHYIMAKSGKKHRVKQRADINLHDVQEKLTKARVSLLIRHPFFGNMATRLTLDEAADWCDTAATDGRHFFYNPSFIDSLTVKETEFLFAHEVLHNAFEHMLRKNDRDHKLFNIAADYAVNQILVDERIGKQIKHTLLDAKYRGKSAEEIYDDLYENATKIDLEDLLDQLLDEHLDGKDGEGDDDKDGEGKGKKKRPKLSDAERKKIRDELKESLIASAQCAGAGNLPAGVARLVESFTAPKMNWRDILRQQIQSVIKSDYTFMTPAKKSFGTPFRLPGLKRDETIDICVAVDASGSINEKMLQEMLSEVAGIMQQYDDYNIKIWSFDTKVYNVEVFRSDEGRSITEYKVDGGGGTDFMCNFDYMKDNDIVPKTFIMLTDGYPFGSWGDDAYCPTIFAITKGGEKIVAPFGTSIYLS